MSSTSETGHAKNVSNFVHLISFVNSYGTSYNPAKDTLKIPHLNVIATKAQSNLDNVILEKTQYRNAINNRVMAFEDLKSLSTRLINALQTTEASEEMIKDAKGFNRKLHGKSASSNTTISTSQQSYDQLIQHFAGLISLLKAEASYKPNESELKIETLTAKQNDLIVKNYAVSVAYATISNSRISRDKALYENNTGLVDVAAEIKSYIKSVFGSSSSEFALIKGIEFKKIAV